MPAEPWQVEDYRALTSEKLFERLRFHDIHLDKDYLLSLAEEVDTPEELTVLLLEDIEPAPTPTEYDQIYLLFFELWRRFITDRPCLSIFCDELDHQIHLHDMENHHNDEAIQDIISNLQIILDENTDKGVDPQEVFKLISSNCAHDIETFLFDYISEQVEIENDTYASELLDGFIVYIEDVKWFDFLRMRLLMHAPKSDSTRFLSQLIDRYSEDKDLEFNLEMLAYMVKASNLELFLKLVKKTLPLIAIEADFQDLLDICSDFFHYLDMEPQEIAVQKILAKRRHLNIQNAFKPKDPDATALLAIF